MATDSRNQWVSGVGLPSAVVEDILSAPHRQTLLQCLADNGGELLVDDAVDRIQQKQTDPPDRQRIREEIYDEHLPKLTATGIVRYDSMRECVRLANPAIVEYADESDVSKDRK